MQVIVMLMVTLQTGINTKHPAVMKTIPEAIASLLLFLFDIKVVQLPPTTPTMIPKIPTMMAMKMSTLAA